MTAFLTDYTALLLVLFCVLKFYYLPLNLKQIFLSIFSLPLNIKELLFGLLLRSVVTTILQSSCQDWHDSKDAACTMQDQSDNYSITNQELVALFCVISSLSVRPCYDTTYETT